MAGIISPELSLIIDSKVKPSLRYAIRYWYLLILSLLTGSLIGYYFIRNVKPVYTSSFTFVLSTEQGGSGVSGLAAQLGLDGGSSGGGTIFTGENIIELFKSRNLIGDALFIKIEPAKDETLLDLVASSHYNALYKQVKPLGTDPTKFNRKQTALFRQAITLVSKSFVVFKKDKKLIFYVINASDTNADVAYFISKIMLDQTSKYFIETKTKGALESVKLLKHEADSLSRLLQATYNSSAAVNDRTYNLNPSISIQRSGIQFNQSKASTFSSSYAQVMQSLESQKLSLQKETPLYKIIDEPELPLTGAGPNKKVHILVAALAALFLMFGLLISDYLYQTKNDLI